MAKLLHPISIETPPAWHTSWAWQIGATNCIIATAFSPTAWYFGVEFMFGYAKGLGVCLGPIWLGFAVAISKDQPHVTH